MSYDLAVWEGERPADDEAGTKYYMEHVASALRNYKESDVLDEPPTPRIRACVRNANVGSQPAVACLVLDQTKSGADIWRQLLVFDDSRYMSRGDRPVCVSCAYDVV